MVKQIELHVGDKVKFLHHESPVPSGTTEKKIISRYGGKWLTGELIRVQNKSEGFGAIKYKVAHIKIGKTIWQIGTHQVYFVSRPTTKLKTTKQLMSML